MSVYFYQTGGDKELIFVEDKSLLPSEGEVNKLYVARKNESDKGALYLWNSSQKQYESISGEVPVQMNGNISFENTEW